MNTPDYRLVSLRLRNRQGAIPTTTLARPSIVGIHAPTIPLGLTVTRCDATNASAVPNGEKPSANDGEALLCLQKHRMTSSAQSR